jgi:myosin heavy subunit
MHTCVRVQALYSGLFEWLVARVNEKVAADNERTDSDLFIAILDIFG